MKASTLSDSSRFAFIVGAPRCGTTTLAGFLQQHPDVCFSAVKEPHYFSLHDLNGLNDKALRERVEEEYLARFFADCGSDQMKAEGSVTYLYAPEKMEPVLRLWPDARFVIALRDPLSMLPSLHARLLVTGDEDIADFTRAWSKVGERAQGHSIPRSAIDPRFLRYDQAGMLGSRVEQFFEAVGRERCQRHFRSRTAKSSGSIHGKQDQGKDCTTGPGRDQVALDLGDRLASDDFDRHLRQLQHPVGYRILDHAGERVFARGAHYDQVHV